MFVYAFLLHNIGWKVVYKEQESAPYICPSRACWLFIYLNCSVNEYVGLKIEVSWQLVISKSLLSYYDCDICVLHYTCSRYRSRRSRTGSRSRSRSPVCYRNRRRSLSRSPMKTRYCALPRAKRRSSRWSRSRSLSHSRSPMKTTRYRASPHAKRRGSRRSRSRSLSHYSRSESPKRANKERSIFSSESPPAKNGVVSYGDGSPVSGKR